MPWFESRISGRDLQAVIGWVCNGFQAAPKVHLMAQRNRSGTLNCLSFVVLRGRDHNRLACAETTLGNGTSGEFHPARNGKDSLLDDSTQAPMPACASIT